MRNRLGERKNEGDEDIQQLEQQRRRGGGNNISEVTSLSPFPSYTTTTPSLFPSPPFTLGHPSELRSKAREGTWPWK